MPRKPKAAIPPAAEAGPVSGIAGTFPETVAGLQMITSLVGDLMNDALKEAEAAGVVDPSIDTDAGQMFGYMAKASYALVRACMVVGLMRADALDQFDEEARLANDT